MIPSNHNRREFIKGASGLAISVMAGPLLATLGCLGKKVKPVVSIVKISDDHIDYAIEKAIDLLGGMETVARGKGRIMLKPNLVAEGRDFTTKPEVIRPLVRLMKKAGKEVCIGEGSAAGNGFNLIHDKQYQTHSKEILDPMQQYVFDTLGYTELAKTENIPLINLHSGEMAEVRIRQGLVFNTITLHKSLTEIDLLCSVPMMKTHVLATVTLGMKNLMGLYPGTRYCSVRSCVHNEAFEAGSPGISFEILDIVRANKLGLTVIDASTSMEGDGPAGGTLLKTDLIIAGTHPLATDMVAARAMGFSPEEIPTFTTAFSLGMKPDQLADIEIRGEKLESVSRKFIKPHVIPWENISSYYGAEEI